MHKTVVDRSRIRSINDMTPESVGEGVCFFEADGLTFAVRVADGTSLVAGGQGVTARRAIQKRLSELPVHPCDLRQSAYAPALNRSRLTLMIAQQCNLRCVYCYGGDGEYGSPGIVDREGSVGLIERFLERPGPGQRTINFFGGEPLLCFDLLCELTSCAVRQAVRYDREPIFTMTTNATLVTPAISAWLARHRFSVMVSIDGDAQMHGRNRPDANGHNSWDATINGAKLLLRDLGPHAVTARVTLTADFPAIDGMLKGLEELGFQSIALCAVEPSGGGKVSALTKDDFQRLHTAVETLVVPHRLSTGRGASWDPLKSAVNLLQTGRRRERACGVGNLSSAVSSDGNLYPCHRYVSDRRFIIGKSIDGLVDDALPGFTAFEEARRLSLTDCDECIAKAFCAGSCAHIAVSRMDKGLIPHDEEICEFIRTGVREALRVVTARRVPPGRGTVAVIGPEYMKRPFRLEPFREMFESRRQQSLKKTTWSEEELAVLRANYATVSSYLDTVVPTLRKETKARSEEWLTHGLVKFLVTAGIFGALDETALKLLGAGTALAKFKDVDKNTLEKVIRLGEEIIAGELLMILNEWLESFNDEETSHYLPTLPALGVARLGNDQNLEQAIKSFVTTVLPLRRRVEDYERLLTDIEGLNTNPWFRMIQETFGKLSGQEVSATARHPTTIDMAAAQITMEMRRLGFPSSWQQEAVEIYTGWLITQLRKSASVSSLSP